MGNDIERRPPQDLEINYVDPLLSELHFLMNTLTHDSRATGVWPLSFAGARGTRMLRILPDKVIETYVVDGLAIIKESTHGRSNDLDFFRYKSTATVNGKVGKQLLAEVSVDRNGVCKLANPHLLRGISFRLGKFREMVDEHARKNPLSGEANTKTA